MTTFTKIIRISECDERDIMTRKIPNIEHFKFILELNDELLTFLPQDLSTKYFTSKVLGVTARNLLSQLILRDLIYQRLTRVENSDSHDIVKALIKKSDPSLQILKDQLSLDVFHGVSTLICTKIIHTPPSSLFTLKIQLSC